MFFTEASDKGDNIELSLDNFKTQLGTAFADIPNVLDTILKIESQATRLNSIFGQNRQRIDELSSAVQKSSTEIIRLGGSYDDVGKTIGEIALASRRNVIASSEEVEEMFAASKILGESVDKISNSFMDVGMSLQGITDQLDTSISYIQSVGGNVSQIYKKILENTEQLNRFQFEGGVQGLTKMAAQATMLRFDMNETFKLADKVLSPEGAIEVASAFQRLGVSAGALVDPFQLMNMSINDPQGLQDALVDVTKQFTYFDEKTKSFKINPQGVLILREMEQQTGLSAKEMSKLGLAASELDERLSQISPSIKFENEEDRQYLANIGRMGDGGEYEVKIKDDEGKEETKRLSELTQEEINKLIEEQKAGQDTDKTLMKTAEDQLSLTNLMLNELKALTNEMHLMVVSNDNLLGTNKSLLTEFQQLRTDVLENRSTITETALEATNSAMTIFSNYIKTEFKSIKEVLDVKNIGDKTTEGISKIQKANDVISPSGGVTMISTKENELIQPSINDDVVAAPNLISMLKNANLIKGQQMNIDPISNVMGGVKSDNTTTNIRQVVEFVGTPTLTVKHEFPAEMSNLTRETKMKLADEIVNSPQLISQIRDNFTKMNGFSALKPTNPYNTSFSPNS